MTALLSLDSADVYYNKAQALHSVSVSVSPSEVVALIGRNGAGKSTTLKALAGLLPCRNGRRVLDNIDVSDRSVEDINRLGVSYVPEDRQVFPNLTVEENLSIARVARRGDKPRWNVEAVWELFPSLLERRAVRAQNLSGGEQQMLSVGRGIMCDPRVLLLDEPTEGLSPIVVEALLGAMRKIAESGVAMVIVEQNFRVPMLLADRFLVLDGGRVQWSGDAEALQRDRTAVEKLISV